MDWLEELRQRKVFRVAAVYAGVGFVLVQAAAYLFEALLFPPWAHRLFVIFVLLGFPVALVLAWAFELTPEGVRPSGRLPGGGEAGTEERDRSRAATGVLVVVLVGGVMAIGGWAALDAWLAPDRDGSNPATAAAGTNSAEADLPERRIAVLYFDDHSEGDSLRHVANGFTESLIHELNQAPGLEVVSRTGVKPFRNPRVSFDSIARALNAGSLVEGSVERQGEDLLVTVQLVDGATGSHIMSERIEGSVGDPLGIRDQLVPRVAELLRKRLGREIRLQEARADTESSRAWELYHLGGEIQSDADSFREEGDPEAARRLYLQADSVLARSEALDPGWWWPTIRRGDIALRIARVGAPEVSEARRQWLERGVEHANRILREDPDHAGALELRGELRYYLARTQGVENAERTLRAAEEDLRGAVEQEPGRAGAWARLAYLLWNDARFAEARSAVRRSQEADPFLLAERDYLYLTASLALDLEDFDRARDLLGRAREAYPEDPSFHFKQLQYLASTGADSGAVREAWEVLDRLEAVIPASSWPPGVPLVAAVAARAGMEDSAATLLDRLGPASDRSPNINVNAAYAYLQLDEEERALDLLSGYLEANPGQRDYVAREWWWRPLRDHPRFRQMVADSVRLPAVTGRR
jgi:TolB-like protein